jgi:hypothetical protein
MAFPAQPFQGSAMQIQVNSNDSLNTTEGLSAKVEAHLEHVLGRFESRLTRIEVHLNDVNSGKGGEADKRCMMEARPNGHAPVAVTHQAGTLPEAWQGAANKLRSLLETTFGKLDAKNSGTPRGNIDM